MKKKTQSTYETFIEKLTPQQKKAFDEGYRKLLLSELILAAIQKDEVAVNELAKGAGVAPAMIQALKTGYIIKYKNYIGQAIYDDQAQIFHGDVLGLKDVITFQGTTLKETKQALKDSINDYLDWCKERNEKPEKTIL